MSSDIPLSRRNAVSGWRNGRNTRKVVTLAVVAILAVGGGYAAFTRYLASNQPPPAPQTVAVRSGSLVSTVTATGSVVATRQAKLGFPASGRLAELKTAVGESVKAGQQLARLDSTSLEAKVTQAESSLRVARIKLDQMKEGATPEDLAAAQAAYRSALAKYNDTTSGAKESDKEAARLAVNQATLTLSSAQSNLDQLKSGPTEVDLINARAAVEQAKSSLASAEIKLDTLKAGPTQSEWATALASVENARGNLQTAQTKVDQMKAGTGQTALEIQNQEYAVQQAASSLLKAKDQLENWKNGDRSGGTSNSQVQDAVVNAQTNYDIQVAKLNQMRADAPADLTSALTALAGAQASFNAAQAKVDLMKAGPLPGDLVTTQASVESAKSSLAVAEAKLELLLHPTEASLADSQAKVDQAQANLIAAQVKLSDLEAGPKAADIAAADSSLASAKASLATKVNPPKATDLALQEESVAQAEQNLKQAQADLAGAVITAPFDGVVSAVAGNVGEQVSAAVVTLVDPKAIRVDVTVDETDVAKLQTGQTAVVSFDALPDLRLQGKVASVAPAGTTSQGVVSYLVYIGVGSPPRVLPAGMSASVSVETERKDNVLLVPNRAIKTQGRNKVVDVMVGEKTETKTVQVGSSNDQFTQITSGLSEGDVVIIPTTTVRSTMGGATGPGGGVPAPAVKVQQFR